MAKSSIRNPGYHRRPGSLLVAQHLLAWVHVLMFHGLKPRRFKSDQPPLKIVSCPVMPRRTLEWPPVP
jgi:hypothetical protein